MEKFIKLLPYGLLLSFVIKMLLTTPTIADMGIIFSLASVLSLKLSLDKKEEIQEVKDNVFKQNEEIKLVVNKQNEVIQVMAIEHAKIKTLVEGIKLKNEFVNGNGLKKVI